MRALRKRYGRGRRKTASNEAVHQTTLKLLNGKRLEFEVPGRPILYAGSSTAPRRDPFWVEHPSGRIYYETAQEAASYVQRHLGDKALEKAKVYSA